MEVVRPVYRLSPYVAMLLDVCLSIEDPEFKTQFGLASLGLKLVSQHQVIPMCNPHGLGRLTHWAIEGGS